MSLPAESPRIARGFDRLSPIYDKLVDLFPGGAIWNSQIHFVSEVLDAHRALIVGGGTGRFLVQLLEQGFGGHVLYLDLSPAMVTRCRRTVERGMPHALRRIEFRSGGLSRLQPDETFDLVCTHYFLDLFLDEELPQVMGRLDRALQPGGRWLCSDFVHLVEARVAPRDWAYRAFVRLLYQGFRMSCSVRPRRLPDIEGAFGHVGFGTVRERRWFANRIWAALLKRDASMRRASRDGPNPE